MMVETDLRLHEKSHVLGMIARVEEVKRLIKRGSLRQVVEIRDQAEAVKFYAARHAHFRDAYCQMSEVSLRAARRAGELLAGMEKQSGARGKGVKVESHDVTLLLPTSA